MKRLIGGGLMALVTGLGMVAAPPAQAQYGGYITSVVYWTGPNCIPVRYPQGYYINTGMICGGYSERSYYASVGQSVGADPMPFDTTTTVGCSLLVNGVATDWDYAPPGDRHNVDCLRTLMPWSL